VKLITIAAGADRGHVGTYLSDGRVLDLTTASADPALASMLALVAAGPGGLELAERLRASAEQGALPEHLAPASDVTLLAPIPRPSKSVYCVGLNFSSHVRQNAIALGQDPDLPSQPLFFSKPVTSVVGPGDPIRHDSRLTAKLDYEVELAVVIGRRGTWIPVEKAADHIFGYTTINDVSARDLQWASSQFLYGKGQDSYCPLGPSIVTRSAMPPLADVELVLRVNGEIRQRESAGNMLFTPEVAIAELSKGITLEPGDIISLGTPDGCGYQLTPPRFLVPGDVVECDVTEVGVLANPVVDVSERSV
jgi:2-keto-4-pentenoate hydratase/2-oxohepta-3-ene-1,7-dioic acid hydratase in catechol pathway